MHRIVRTSVRTGRLALMAARRQVRTVSQSSKAPLPVVNWGRKGSLPALPTQKIGFRFMSSLPEHTVHGLPALSPTMTQGNLVEWVKKEGEAFGAGDVICRVETDKATVDFEAQEDGIIAKILVPEGTNDVPVGKPIFVSVEEEGDLSAFKDFKAEGEGAPSPPASKPEPKAEAPAKAPETKPAPPSPPAASTSAASPSGGRTFASPLARKIAREAGVDVATVAGTGPNGRVLASDVSDAIARGIAAVPEAAEEAAKTAGVSGPSGERFEDLSLSERVRALADKLTKQKQEVPHYYLTVEVTVDKLLKARDELNASLNAEEHLSVNDFIVRAAALAMKKVPDCNAAWMETFVRQFHDVNVNITIQSPEGVVAPVLRNVESKGLYDIARESRQLLDRTTSSSLEAEDVGLGTFSITNQGMYGVKNVLAIVPQQQACVLGIGAIEKRVVPNDDPTSTLIYKYSEILTVSLSCDHRVIDGSTGALWLAAFKGLLENPLTMLL